MHVHTRSGKDGAIHFHISDTGVGIPEEKQSQIFDPYYTTKSKGTGLGLAIVHKIVESHGGRITVHSRPGQGTRFHISLPPSENRRKPKLKHRPWGKGNTMPHQQTHMLIVDDDRGHLATLKTIVSSWGYQVTTAEDGSIAVKMVKTQPFDLILMDVRMTEMDGIEALRQIKVYNPAIPILIMTAYSSVASAVDALKAGAYDYLTKPLDFETLRLTAERAMEHTHLRIENHRLKKKLGDAFDWQNIIGTSPPMRALIEMVAMVAPSEATVLITGESGTGKELIARSIHFNSRRSASHW